MGLAVPARQSRWSLLGEAPAIMIGEKAAELIAVEHGITRAETVRAA